VRPVKRVLLVCASLATTIGCSNASERDSTQILERQVNALADTVLAALFEHFADWETYFGTPNARHDRLPDNSLATLRRWHDRENHWLTLIEKIDASLLEGRPTWVTLGMLREGVASSVETRVCRNELWGVNQFGGWQTTLTYLADIQPVGTDELRAAALRRWRTLPRYIDTEIGNLREGLRLGYSAPAENVRQVIAQLEQMFSDPHTQSPFYAPAVHDSIPAFREAVGALVRDEINPALRRFRDFLSDEYLPRARTSIALTTQPDGDRCYRASLRGFATLDLEAKEVYRVGQREVEAIEREMQSIAAGTFGERDLASLRQRMKTEPSFMFRKRDEILELARASVKRADSLAPQWFGRLPKSGVAVEPYPEHLEASSVAEYNPPAEDGSRPGQFLISTYEPTKRSRVTLQSITFHEAVPGHHLATAIALEGRDSAHAITRYLNNAGYIEGWALYAERLADEMGLFSSPMDRFGMLSEQLWRALRMVVDPAIHTMGWTRQQAIDYMLAHSLVSSEEAAAEVDRYVIWPGQAPSYMIGMIELRTLRERAQRTLGADFDIRTFHDLVLEDGSLPLPVLRAKIGRWLEHASDR
jgi:uncharacterized protein (DUF885 family)